MKNGRCDDEETATSLDSATHAYCSKPVVEKESPAKFLVPLTNVPVLVLFFVETPPATLIRH